MTNGKSKPDGRALVHGDTSRDSPPLRDENALRDALRVAVPVEPEEKVAARRAALLSVLEREIAETPHRMERDHSRARWRKSAQLVSAAAALVATLGLGMFVSELDARGQNGTAQRAPVGSSEPAADGTVDDTTAHRSLAGQVFETEAGHEKMVQMGGDTKVTLSAHTKMMVERDSRDEQHVYLTTGGVSISVPAHRKNRSVQVRTKHATVQVTGTVFGVEVGRFAQPAGSAPRTRVSVERGQVIVLHRTGKIVLEPGDTWLSPLDSGPSVQDGPLLEEGRLEASSRPIDRDPVGGSVENGRDTSTHTPSTRTSSISATPSSATQSDASAVRLRPAQGAQPSDVSGSSPRSVAEEELESTLADQNDLLEKVLAAENRGNEQQARDLVEKFLARYPRSPLRASAIAVRKRLSSSE